MNQIIRVEGRRIYITLPYGHPLTPRLKDEVGVHWDADAKAWWCGSAKREHVERILAETAEAVATPPSLDDTRVRASARYKGKLYRVAWIGETKDGKDKARLISVDGKIDFWVDPAGIVLTKEYERREIKRGGHTRWTELPTVGSLRRWAERSAADRQHGERRTCWECGRSVCRSECRDGEWDEGASDCWCGC